MAPALHLAFAGTPGLAAAILKTLVEHSPHRVTCVYTRPDRPAGRGRKLHKSPVKDLAERYQLEVRQPADPDELDREAALEKVDVLVVAAFGMILSESVLNKPRFGAINIHTSLLPRWRGAAPVPRAILAGDARTGITIMQMDAGLDTGDILYQQACTIQPDDTAGTLTEKLSYIGSECILIALDELINGSLEPVPQGETGITYAHKILKSEAGIDWTRTASEIDRRIRAFNPSPIAVTTLNQQPMRIWQAMVLDQRTGQAAPGTVIGCSPEGLDVAAADRVVRVLKLQLPGKKVISSRDFFNGHPQFCTG